MVNREITCARKVYAMGCVYIISDLSFFLSFFFFCAELLIDSINNLGVVALINLARVGHAYLSTLPTCYFSRF